MIRNEKPKTMLRNILILQERCKHFKDDNVRKVFELVAADEMLINKKVPDFERITVAINNAIDTIFKRSRTTQSDWMKKLSTGDFSKRKL